MRRTILFGDIHGCYQEWQALLDLVSPGPEDRLIALGDLICKGPSSLKTLELARSLPSLTCLLGNHERRLRSAWRKGEDGGLKPCEAAAKSELGGRFEEFMAWLAGWPSYVELPGLLAVHAGLRPGLSLDRQSPRDLAELRRLDDGRPWYELYQGPPTAVFGHWVRREVLMRGSVVGLDTGCVYGGKLSAYVWPEGRVLQVPSRRAYAEKTGDWA